MSDGSGARAARTDSGRGDAFDGSAAIEVAGNSANKGLGVGGAAGRVIAYPKNTIPVIRTSRPRIWLPRTDGGSFPQLPREIKTRGAAHCKQMTARRRSLYCQNCIWIRRRVLRPCDCDSHSAAGIAARAISQSVSERRIEHAGKPNAGLLQLLPYNRFVRLKIGHINGYVCGVG